MLRQDYKPLRPQCLHPSNGNVPTFLNIYFRAIVASDNKGGQRMKTMRARAVLTLQQHGDFAPGILLSSLHWATRDALNPFLWEEFLPYVGQR